MQRQIRVLIRFLILRIFRRRPRPEGSTLGVQHSNPSVRSGCCLCRKRYPNAPAARNGIARRNCCRVPSAWKAAGGTKARRARLAMSGVTTLSPVIRKANGPGCFAMRRLGICMACSAEKLSAYAELHCLSNFTFLRGASHPEELVAQDVAQGYTALALTDECSLAGVVRAHLAAKEAGLKFIIGSEITVPQGDLTTITRAGPSLRGAVDGLKLIFLASNRHGYGNLSALITLARRRAEKGAYALQRGDLESFAPSGAVPDCLVLWLPGETPSAADAAWLAERFPGRAWIAVELHAGPDDAARLENLQALSEVSGLPLVAAGDVHMHTRSRRPLQDVLTALRLKTTVFDAGYALFPNGERHLRSRLRLSRLYPPALLAESLKIAERCQFSLDELRYEYPEEIIPAGETPSSWLRAETERGLQRRYPAEKVPESVRQRIEYELKLIAEMAYEAYFLTVHDIVCFAREQGILQLWRYG